MSNKAKCDPTTFANLLSLSTADHIPLVFSTRYLKFTITTGYIWFYNGQQLVDKSICTRKDNIIIVEGAPDVLRLQSIGLDNTVASLGTAWSDTQFSQLRNRVAFCYLISTLFRDIIFKKTHHFPILNLFGEKGTGKTTLATSLQSFFIHGIDPPNLSATSLPAMNDRVSQAVNTLVVFDEYKNDLDIRTIGFLKGLWGGGGQTKKNTATDGMDTQTIV